MSARADAIGALRCGRLRGVISPLPSQQLFLAVSALLFAASAVLTVVWCGSMSAMPGMPMSGGWTMSMAWMRMPGQTWLGAAASFTGMWAVMMIAMMMPSLIPMLQRYRDTIGRAGESRPGRLTAVAGAGYYVAWTALGVIVFPLGVALASIEMRFSLVARAVPAATGVVMLIAGALQFTRWKAHHLSGCREDGSCGHARVANSGSAFRNGLRLGLHCIYCCAGLTAILLAVGVMDLRAMALVTAAITAERLAPSGNRVARAIGAAIIVLGVVVAARAVGLA
jgi:predicted metal-binding membrane protein